MLTTPAGTPLTKFETILVRGILLITFVVQANAIVHHGAYGQDFALHKKWVFFAVQHPIEWLFSAQDHPSPPVYHFLVSLVYRACDGIHWVAMTGLISALINAVTLRLFYALSRLLISNVTLRLSLLVLVAFLPVNLIHTVVLATDSVSQFPFLVILYALGTLCLGQISQQRALAYCTVASVVGFSTKYIAVSFLPAILCAVPLLCLAKILSWRRGLTFLAIFLCLGSSLEYYWLTQKKSNISANFSPQMGNLAEPPAKINLRSLLFFRPGDAYLLTAPTYGTLVRNYPSSPQSLYNTNYFSFPGLAIFGTFTDSFNIFQVKEREPVGYRMTRGQKGMALAVKIGLGVTVALLLGTMLVLLAASRDLWVHHRPEAAAVLCIGLFGFAWLAFIMTLLPFATVGVLFGYWMPRLYIPSIMTIGLLGFYALDQLSIGRRWSAGLSNLILVMMILEAGLHVSFLWRWVPF